MQCPRQEGNSYIYIYNLETIASVDSSVHGRNRAQGAQPKHGAYSESRLV